MGSIERNRVPSSAGYSGTPLRTKLGQKAGDRALLVNVPPALDTMLSNPSFRSVTRAVSPNRLRAASFDYIHLFTMVRFELTQALEILCDHMAADGMIWVSWPKKAARLDTDVTEDVVRQVALPLGLVDIKVCAVDETWSGLKLVLREHLRTSR